MSVRSFRVFGNYIFTIFESFVGGSGSRVSYWKS